VKCKASHLITLVLEVAWNESLDTLRGELELWKQHNDVRIVIGIKIFGSKKMKLIKFTRQVNGDWKLFETDFGVDIPRPPNLNLKVEDLYYGSPVPPELSGVSIISLCLSDLRDNILDEMP
jgi:hypothetical protein